MALTRSMSEDESRRLAALLRLKPETAHFIAQLEGLAVQEMDDGGMGSLLLIPKGMEHANRMLGRQTVAGEFVDSDGVLVSVTINTDRDDKLYELDVWKVDFSPLLRWPEPNSIRLSPVADQGSE
jgi:hypothetical protein